MKLIEKLEGKADDGSRKDRQSVWELSDGNQAIYYTTKELNKVIKEFNKLKKQRT